MCNNYNYLYLSLVLGIVLYLWLNSNNTLEPMRDAPSDVDLLALKPPIYNVIYTNIMFRIDPNKIIIGSDKDILITFTWKTKSVNKTLVVYNDRSVKVQNNITGEYEFGHLTDAGILHINEIVANEFLLPRLVQTGRNTVYNYFYQKDLESSYVTDSFRFPIRIVLNGTEYSFAPKINQYTDFTNRDSVGKSYGFSNQYGDVYLDKLYQKVMLFVHNLNQYE